MKQDLTNEQNTLACLLQHDVYIEICDILKDSYFTDAKNQLIFSCLKHVCENNSKLDKASIYSAAVKLGKLEFLEKTSDYLDILYHIPTSKENIKKYAGPVIKVGLINKLILSKKKAINELSRLEGDESIDKILSVSEEGMLDVYQEDIMKDNGPILIGSKIASYLDDLQKRRANITGIPTPFANYNACIGGGLRTGGVNMIVTRSGGGKSTVGKEIGIFVAQKTVPVLYLDSEMLLEEQMGRVIAGVSGNKIDDVEQGKIFKNQIMMNKVTESSKSLEKLPIYHQVIAGKQFSEVLSIIKRWIYKCVGFNEDGKANPCLVIYDYFKIMNTADLEKQDEWLALGFQISNLTDYAKELGFACLSFTQVNRQGIEKEHSGIIAGSDRLLWLSHSMMLMKPKEEEELAETGTHGNMKMIWLKSRFGQGLNPGDYINFQFDRAKSKFTEGPLNSQVSKADKFSSSEDGEFQF